jgi:electron transport complex protein RnfC
MLITEIKPKEEFDIVLKDNLIIIICKGCKEIYLPVVDINNLINELKEKKIKFDTINVDYLCNHEYTKLRTINLKEKIDNADNILVFSCGVGVQVVSSYINKHVVAGCNTLYIHGFQGLTPFIINCEQCGQCFLNYTGGLCPITACSKSLLNGPCGGAKNGKCEIDPEKECGWEKIIDRLQKKNQIELLQIYQNPRKYSLK